MNFCKIMNFQLTPLSKNFLKPCTFLLLLCLGTILAPTCPVSCQPSCSLSPLSGSIRAAWFHPFGRSTTAPTRSCATAPTTSPSESGRGMRGSLSAASRLARPWTPHLAAHVVAADLRVPPRRSCRNQAGLVLRPAGLFAFSSGAAMRRPGTVFLPGEEVFACPGPAAPSQETQTRYPSRQRAPPQRLDL
jgi:hypothetical protein